MELHVHPLFFHQKKLLRHDVWILVGSSGQTCPYSLPFSMRILRPSSSFLSLRSPNIAPYTNPTKPEKAQKGLKETLGRWARPIRHAVYMQRHVFLLVFSMRAKHWFDVPRNSQGHRVSIQFPSLLTPWQRRMENDEENQNCGSRQQGET